MQEIYNFLQRFLRLILPCYILKCDTGLFFHIHLGITLANSHHASAFRHLTGHPYDQCNKYDKRNDIHSILGNNCRSCIRYLLIEINLCFFQFLHQLIIIHPACVIFLVDLISTFFLCRDQNPVTLNFNFLDLLLINHLQELVISNFLVTVHSLKLIHSKYQKCRQHRNQYDKRKALFVIFIIILVSVLVVHFSPPVSLSIIRTALLEINKNIMKRL